MFLTNTLLFFVGSILVFLLFSVSDQRHDRGYRTQEIVCKRYGIHLECAVQKPEQTPEQGKLAQTLFARAAVGDDRKNACQERENIRPVLKAQKRKSANQYGKQNDGKGTDRPLPFIFFGEYSHHHGAQSAGNRTRHISLQQKVHDPADLSQKIAEKDGDSVLELKSNDRKNHGKHTDGVNQYPITFTQGLNKTVNGKTEHIENLLCRAVDTTRFT